MEVINQGGIKMIKGIYMMGSFKPKETAFVYFDIKKPFEIDAQRGEIKPCVFHFFKKNVWFDEWEFLEGFKLSDLRTNEGLRDFCNDIWEDWCIKHKRKVKPIFTREPIYKQKDEV